MIKVSVDAIEQAIIDNKLVIGTTTITDLVDLFGDPKSQQRSFDNSGRVTRSYYELNNKSAQFNFKDGIMTSINY